jgi:hypothetical protein
MIDSGEPETRPQGAAAVEHIRLALLHRLSAEMRIITIAPLRGRPSDFPLVTALVSALRRAGTRVGVLTWDRSGSAGFTSTEAGGPLRQQLEAALGDLDLLLCRPSGLLDRGNILTDPLAIAAASDGVVIVCNAEADSLVDVATAQKQLEAIGAQCIGSVLDQTTAPPPAEIAAASIGRLSRWLPRASARWQRSARSLLSDV